MRPLIWGYPVSISVEPTNICNLRCPECPSGTGDLKRPKGYLDVSLYRKIIDEINKHTFYIQLFLQGEPYLHKNLSEMIAYARSKKMYVSISTNAQLLNEKNIDMMSAAPPDKLIISIDGLDEETYQKYRVGGSFEKVNDAIRLIAGLKKKNSQNKPYLELQFIVMKHNEHQMGMVQQFGKEVGADSVKLKSMQIYSEENVENFLPEDKRFRRYKLSGNQLSIKSNLPNRCIVLWRTAVVTWSGRVIPCCFDKDADYDFGSIAEKSLKEIWESDKYTSFRKAVLKNRKGIPICNNCTEGLKLNHKNI